MIVTDGSPRITKVRFAGLRTAASVVLVLDGLTVLIGPNGVGKSTLIEGVELLRKVTTGDDFLRSLHDDHGGVRSLLTHGATELRLEVWADVGAVEFRYQLILERANGGFTIANESLDKYLETGPETLFARVGDTFIKDPVNSVGTLQRIRSRQPLLRSMNSPDTEAIVMLLEGIDVHTGFVTQAVWAGRTAADRSTRGENIVQATSRLARGGTNLPNAFLALRNRDDWQDTLATVRLVVDEDIVDITTPPSASGGSIGLEVKYRTGAVPAFALSDGTLALLSLVAVTSLEGFDPTRSLLVLDEPDLHLHPTAIRYVVTLLEQCAARYPVVIATHSDQLLDCLRDPARSAVLCELDEHRRLRLQRPDRASLEKWLPKYRGVGELRAEGYGSLVFPPPARVADKS